MKEKESYLAEIRNMIKKLKDPAVLKNQSKEKKTNILKDILEEMKKLIFDYHEVVENEAFFSFCNIYDFLIDWFFFKSKIYNDSFFENELLWRIEKIEKITEKKHEK